MPKGPCAEPKRAERLPPSSFSTKDECLTWEMAHLRRNGQTREQRRPEGRRREAEGGGGRRREAEGRRREGGGKAEGGGGKAEGRRGGADVE